MWPYLFVPVSHRLVDLGGPPSPTENQPKSKEVKKANKFLKSIDKDITRVKNNLGPVEGEGEDEEEGYTLTTHNGEGLPVTTRWAKFYLPYFLRTKMIT